MLSLEESAIMPLCGPIFCGRTGPEGRDSVRRAHNHGVVVAPSRVAKPDEHRDVQISISADGNQHNRHTRTEANLSGWKVCQPLVDRGQIGRQERCLKTGKIQLRLHLRRKRELLV